MRNFKSNINYYTKWEGMRSVGLCLMIFGFGALWMGWSISYFIYILGAPALISGIVMFFWGNTGRSSEEEIQAEIKRRKDGIAFPELESERDWKKRVSQRPEVHEFEGFRFREGVYFKKMKNGSLCSSEYERAVMHILTDAFYIKSRRFSLVEEGETAETWEIPFALVERIEIEHSTVTLSNGKKTAEAAVSDLVFTYDGGKRLCILSLDDAYADDLVARLNKIVANACRE